MDCLFWGSWPGPPSSSYYYSVIDHRSFDISKYDILPGSSYIKLPKELDYPIAWLIFKILKIKSALNGVYSNTYILKSVTPQELQKEKLHFKGISSL